MLSQNQICQPIKKMTKRINCERCNKPNMSKKNINAHYKAGCSGIWDDYKKPKEKKEPKEKNPRQPRKSRNKKITFSCSDFIDFTNWLIDEQVILDGDDQDQFHECYQLFKNNQEPPKPTMIIKITYPWTIQKSVQESVEEQVEESVEELVEESVDQPVEESVEESVEEQVEESVEELVEFGDIYPSYEEESFKEENEMIEKDEDDEEVKVYEEYLRNEREKYDLENGIKEEVIEELTEEQIEWQEYIQRIEKVFFQEDEDIENQYYSMNTEEEIELRLSKFIERFDKKEIKKYSISKKNKLNIDMIKQRQQLLVLISMDCFRLYNLNSKKYDFILRNLIELIKLKIIKKINENEDEDELSEEEIKKLMNSFDKNKILEKYNNYIKKWCEISMK